MKKILTHFPVIFGYVLAFLGLVIGFWRMILERPLAFASGSGIVWTATLFMGLMIVQSSEVARLKKILGDKYPSNAKETAGFIAIAVGITAVCLIFILR